MQKKNQFLEMPFRWKVERFPTKLLVDVHFVKHAGLRLLLKYRFAGLNLNL